MKNSYKSLNWKQKILLYLLTLIDDKGCSRLKIFKVAFLLSEKIDFYNFIPYKYGPYSFEMDRDLLMFNRNGWINIEDKLVHADKSIRKALSDILSDEIKYKDEINKLANKFKNIDEDDLVNYIYKNYTYYTQNSLLKRQQRVGNRTAPVSIYTIGYQNLSIDLFINTIIEKGIKTVLDVRNNPFSYKYGFSYYWLNKYLPEVSIKYINVPELGIEGEYRKKLSGNELWRHYSKSLIGKGNYISKASDEILKQPTVLMCYEIDFNDCHRLRLAQKIQDLVDLPIINFNGKIKQWIELNS